MCYMLEAVAMQQVGERCTCMSMINDSPTLVYKMQHVYVTQQLIYALTHAQVRMQTQSHLSV